MKWRAFTMILLQDLADTGRAELQRLQSRRSIWTTSEIASNTFDTTIDRINERRLAFFAPVYLMIGLLRSNPSLHQEAGSKEAILQLVLPALTQNPQISAIYAGYENGNYFQILSISEAEQAFVAGLGGPPATRFAIQDISAGNNGVRVQTWRFLDSERREIGTRTNAQPAYDPRVTYRRGLPTLCADQSS
jgi:adenylate cyclase